MALTQAQWYTKLKTWVPSWWFEEEVHSRGLFQAVAQLFSTLEGDIEAHISETFIAHAEVPFLEAHGDERSLDRVTDESDASYAIRIRNFVNQADKVSIKAIVDALLLLGTCEIREGYTDLPYCSRGAYLSRDQFLTGYNYDFFTIVIDPQAYTGFNFLSRDTYASRGSYADSVQSVSPIYAAIVEAVNRAKALGVLYRIVER